MNRSYIKRVLGITFIAIVMSYSCSFQKMFLFERLITRPVPSSVEIIEVKHLSAIDEVCWMKFNISSNDLKSLIKKANFRIGEPLHSSPTPAWWNPSGPCYRSDRPGQVRAIYVDDSNENVYFLSVSY